MSNTLNPMAAMMARLQVAVVLSAYTDAVAIPAGLATEDNEDDMKLIAETVLERPLNDNDFKVGFHSTEEDWRKFLIRATFSLFMATNAEGAVGYANSANELREKFKDAVEPQKPTTQAEMIVAAIVKAMNR